MRFDRSKLVKPIPLILLILLFLGAAFGQWIGNRFRMMDEERHINIYMAPHCFFIQIVWLFRPAKQ
jgi:hypothetical protein